MNLDVCYPLPDENMRSGQVAVQIVEDDKKRNYHLVASQVVYAKSYVNRVLGPFFTRIQNFPFKFRGSAQSSG